MEHKSGFRTDLYKGTATYYDRFRPPYPVALFDDLCASLSVADSGRLLDMACGTGQIALPMAARFAEVWAVDNEAEFVAYGRAKAEGLGVANTHWITGAAEEVTLDGPFDLITIGNAFHRMNRQLVAERMRSWLRPGGGVALLWSNTPWLGPEPWQQAMDALLADWTAKARATGRVPAGWQKEIDRDPHDQVLRRAGFDYVGKFEFAVNQSWSIESLAGLVYSTSFLSRVTLGDLVPEFEQELIELLGPYAPDGKLHEAASYAYQLALAPLSAARNQGVGE